MSTSARIPPIRLPGLLGRAARPLNQTITQMNDLSSMTGVAGMRVQRGPNGTSIIAAKKALRSSEFFGVLVDAGPPCSASEGHIQPDFTDARYWVKEIYLSQTQAASMTDSVTVGMDASFLNGDGSYGGPRWLVATNLNESMTGTHLLPVIPAPAVNTVVALPTGATIVRVYVESALKTTTLQNDFGNQVWCFEPITNVAVSAVTIAAITGHTGTGPLDWGPYQGTLPNGTVINLYNGFEPVNGSPGTLGVTVGTDGNVTGTSCYVQPIGAASVLVIWNPANHAWFFSAPNSAGS